MIHFTHFQTFPKIPTSGQKFSTTLITHYARLPSIKTAIEVLLTMKLPAKSKHDANGSLFYLKSFVASKGVRKGGWGQRWP